MIGPSGDGFCWRSGDRQAAARWTRDHASHAGGKPEEYQALRCTSPHESLADWADANMKGYDEICTMGNVLPQLVNDSRAGTIIMNMSWQVLHLLGSKVDLLISDRPDALRGTQLPQLLFVASNWDRGFERMPPTKIARMANVTTVKEAHTRLYGTGPPHRPLAEKWLATSIVH